MQRYFSAEKIMILMVFAFGIVSCAKNPVTGKRQLMLMSEKQEIQMGKEYDPQIIASFGLYEDEELSSFIEEEGSQMGKLSHRPDLKYYFRILDSPVINAFAAPGGYIYFTRGILTQFNSEAELMGVLGHEMGHITARHMVSRQSKQQLGQLLLIGGMIASEDFARYAQYAMAGMQLLFLKFSRDDERQSDRLGVEYASKMGYDASRMAEFFQVLDKMQAESEGGGIPFFLSTHPDPGDRYSTVHELAEEWKDSLDTETWTVNEDPYLKMIDGMVYGEDPRQGYVENGVFYHPELKFQFPVPSGWDVENTPLQVRMGPPERDAILIFNLVEGNSLEQAASESLRQLELNVQQEKRITVNGMNAIATISTQESQASGGGSQIINIMSYFINDQGTYYAFHGVAPQEVFNNYRTAFESTMTDFDQLSDASKINVKPQRIQIVRARQSSTLAEVFNQNNVPQDKMQETAFLNNMELNQRVQPGKLIKIIR